MSKTFSRINILLFVTIILLSKSVFANVVTLGTRVIYPQGEREVTVQLKNDGELPSLIQAWIDDGNTNTPINKIKVPFVLIPPVFRIEPNKGQTLRISYTGGTLPEDKESVYFLNILDIPPKNANSGQNTLQMAIRSRIKIFFRPGSLDADGASEALKNVQWSLTKDRQLQGKNPSAYYVNIAGVEISVNGKKINTTEGEMLAPREIKVFKSAPLTGVLAGSKLTYKAITDFGGVAVSDSYINGF
ncbi:MULTISPECIES: fimbria/pilus periplasmic chaperone [Serratia]|uniref:Fimbria/pilus periplasmic chaperone n=1 Tax=Serratia fonticola TaxID=47917 RepID=A0AAE7JV38_SERFO|nr:MULTISPECIES: fimbria/pilus periplasmic chaperone [Serratia]MDK2376549.1 fimbria/pilus periplasmic chaperone [Serratia fonticola]QKJ60786.1 fimbria/pilus periplasmic chaperone [Serratia fonticola]